MSPCDMPGIMRCGHCGWMIISNRLEIWPRKTVTYFLKEGMR